MLIVDKGKIGPDSDGVTYVGVGISCIITMRAQVGELWPYLVTIQPQGLITTYHQAE